MRLREPVIDAAAGPAASDDAAPDDVAPDVAARAADSGIALAERIERAVARAPAAVEAAWRRLLGTPLAADPGVRELLRLLAAQRGGKYLRSRLAAAAYLGTGGDDPDVCDALGAAVQLLHLGLCVHDDLIDGDDQRHGRPNIAGSVRAAWRAGGVPEDVADRQAVSAALLAGDLAIAESVRVLVGAPTAPAVRVALLAELLSSLEEAIAGELLDVRTEQAAPADAAPIRVAELKTSGYSVVLPLRLGATASGGADAAALDALAEFGRHLGIAYQLRDDELAVFGDPLRTGKSASSDVRGGKRTRLLQLALHAASPEERRLLESHVGRADLPDEGVERVRDVMRATGALERHRALVVEHAARAVAALDGSGLPGPLADFLRVVARSVPGRDS